MSRIATTALTLMLTLGVAACGSSASPNGSAASAQPSRTIEIAATDQLNFTPAAVTVQAGSTVAFRVTNTGTLKHEFVIGDSQRQDQHEQEMQQMQHMGGSGMHAGHEAGSAEVPPGQTVTIVYTFGQSGSLMFGCHVAGHYPAGMKGSISIG